MAILSVKYPIIFTGSSSGFEYTIYEGSGTSGNVVYRGKSYGAEVDVSPVLQDFLNADLVNVSKDNLPIIESNKAVQSFTVTNGTTTQTFMVANDYNDQYITEYDSPYITSKSITGKYHPDSLVFVDVNSPDADSIIQVGQNITISGNNSDQIAVRVDGIYSFDLITRGNATPLVLNAVIYIDGLFVAVGGGGSYATSTDGVTWSNGNTGLAFPLYGIAYGNGLFVAVGSIGNYATSPDGQNWTTGSIGSSTLNGIAYGNGLFVAVGGGGSYATSPDGQNWTTGSIGKSSTMYDIIFNNGLFVTVGIDGNYATSQDGQNWTNGNTGGRTLNGVTYANRQYIAVGVQGGFATSVNGNSWELGETGGLGNLMNIVYGNNLFVAVGTQSYAISPNGKQWDLGSTGGGFIINDIIYLNGSFYSVGAINNPGASKGGYAIFGTSVEPTVITVNGELIEFEITGGCNRHTLYWVNMLGGRSQLLLEGKHNSTYNNDWNRFKTNYDRTIPESFEHRTISNLVTRSWTLYTGILNDFQSEELRDLFNSPKVWLHDHTEDRIYSVVITDSAKRMKTQDVDHIYQYEINVDEAQTHIRR